MRSVLCYINPCGACPCRCWTLPTMSRRPMTKMALRRHWSALCCDVYLGTVSDQQPSGDAGLHQSIWYMAVRDPDMAVGRTLANATAVLSNTFRGAHGTCQLPQMVTPWHDS